MNSGRPPVTNHAGTMRGIGCCDGSSRSAITSTSNHDPAPRRERCSRAIDLREDAMALLRPVVGEVMWPYGRILKREASHVT